MTAVATTTEANKQVTRRFIEAWSAGNIEAAFAWWSPEVVHHARFADHPRESIKLIYAMFMEAFPDLQFDIADMIAEGDKVVTRLTARATHTGEFAGMPPTGKQITCTTIDIVRIADGKIVEHWGLTDELHLLAQLGLVPGQFLASMS